ncbi:MULTISPECIES: NACHT domain-containing NTPase [Microbacterium]|uniref:NACHT domain-containing protein n=1 Tax=Microbacterium TaxID=33882 RepID=UPI00277F20DF|nr:MULTISPECIES: hypothetical protein [Microbacterium]MDQ1084570.1 hypothetical protein [Microbacterium sp. SORGH_AS_0344]MDQ1170152.1 hypothetical protein [Microbacterium proteolyticum]
MRFSQHADVDRATAVQSGAALIHYAVHYGDVGVIPLGELFFAVPEIAALFRSLAVSSDAERAWRRDPQRMLTGFLEELEAREEAAPSHKNGEAARDLSARETAIIITRFLTYPGAETYAAGKGRSRPVSLRQQHALSLPDRASPAYRRFDITRQRSSSGHYWSQFEAELREYLQRAEIPRRLEAMKTLPASTRTLIRHSERYADDLSVQLLGTLAGMLEPADLYVERTVEARLLDQLLNGPATVLMLRGEAGAGKSSVLWSLRQKLIAEGMVPLLLSATWIVAGGSDHLLGIQELVEHTSRIKSAGLDPVVLLDTADLLLHTEGLIYQTADLLEQLDDLGVRTLITVRPIEAGQLPHDVRPYDLQEYEGEELEKAVTVLMRQYFPKLAPEIGSDLVERARTRGLPILTVLRSPLLLRMLFDTSGGEFPGLDYDATALYERYWETRINRDIRGGRVSSERDLSPIAGRLAILMLADATPILADTRVSTTLPVVAYPTSVEAVTSSIDELADRGVLVRGDLTWRFAHQTLFEFIAARALLVRNGPASAALLLEHVRSHPHDLFTGAVLEQLVILLARDIATRSVARDVVAQLLAESYPSVRQLGVIGWCHVPELATGSSQLMDAPTAARVLGHLPQIQSIDAEQVLTLLRTIWRDHRDVAHRALIDCLALLVHRWPHQIGRFVIEEAIVSTLLTSFLRNYNQSAALVDLTVNLAHADPAVTRQLLLDLVSELPEVAGPLRSLRGIAANWALLEGTDAYARAVLDVATESERRFRSHHRDFGIAAGNVLYASRRHRFHHYNQEEADAAWETLAIDVLSRVTTTSPTIPDAAALNAVARHLIDTPASEREHVARILDYLFGQDPADGPLHVVGSFLMALVTSESLARELVVDALFEALERGLPASANRADSPAQRWALTARATLIDPETPETFVADVVADLLPNEARLWRDPAFLLSAAFPAAIGGDARASALLTDVKNDPHVLSGPLGVASLATTEFIERGLEYADRAAAVADAVVLVAAATRRAGPIATLAGTAIGAAAIRRHRIVVRELIATMLRGSDSQQREVCTCWKRLQEHRLLTTGVREITEAFAKVRDPQGRASLIEMLPAAVAYHLPDAPAALAFLRQNVPEEPRDADVSVLSDARKRLIDAAFSAYRAILATIASPEEWDPLWDRVTRPALQGSGRIDTDRFRDVGAYLHNLLRNYPDQLLAATERLIAAASWAKDHLSDKQAKSVANLLANTARRIVQAGGEPARHLIEAVNVLPVRLSQTVLTTAIATSSRYRVERLLADGVISPGLAAEAVERLRGHREAGFQPIPQLITGPVA